MAAINDRITATTIEAVVLALSAIGTVFTLGRALWFSRYGIDFTDEDFYPFRIAPLQLLQIVDTFKHTEGSGEHKQTQTTAFHTDSRY